ncbi:TPA: type VI secretion system contractile sheath large subunit, partial [Enterobacter hormaechei subsp. steigerwaltii]|nr:type VI secretion system contractile sheath large subunit [Enterobacter hormaechei]HED2221917.1 type VI secretion system contractile sheath large subunit [Enterobacter hormaechei subsp. steigerwaltii]HED2279533.1 type VI secretion system contractile sheath large subunit [Enterobacter hormaechei subsp. steigerwaltii]HED3381322.1 type VI secretion system contractile sheath large subunit [Enterobacter hormaechei subsp. steigerwaltii]HED3417374.1 type VI secretion system contractile sheath large
SRQLDAVMHHQEFQKVESLWRGLKQLVDSTDYRQNVKTEILDVSKEDLRQDFEDAPELIQSGLYWHTYTAEYDTPGGEPIGSVISSYEFDASPQDVALLRNISKVSAAAHMPFIGSVGPKFFLKDSMEEVAAIKDIGNYFDRAEYIKWKSFRDTDDARYIGLVMPRVLGRLPYGPDTRATVYHHDRCRIPLKQPVAMSTCQPVSLKHRPVMGTHATDVNGQVLLRLSTDNPEEVRGWLPGGDLHADLMALLHVWLGAHLDVRMQLCVARHLLPDARLSCNAEQTAQVGRTAVLRPLNAQQNRNDIITIHLGRFQRVRENIQRRKNDEDGDYRW